MADKSENSKDRSKLKTKIKRDIQGNLSFDARRIKEVNKAKDLTGSISHNPTLFADNDTEYPNNDPNYPDELNRKDIANSSDKKRRKSFLSSFIENSEHTDHNLCNSSMSASQLEKSLLELKAETSPKNNRSQILNKKKTGNGHLPANFYDQEGNLSV